MTCFLVDTSLWVAFFRGKSLAIKNRLLDLAASNRIFYNGIVLMELLNGSKSDKQYQFVTDNFLGLQYLEMDKDFFVECSAMTAQLKSAGLTMSMSDIMIATHAKLNNLFVYSMDKHFELAGPAVGFQFEILKNFSY